MSDLVGILRRSAALVKAWGGAQLSSGKTLAETFTLDGLPMWDILSADLALYRIPPALALGSRRPTLKQQAWPYLSWAKQAAHGLLPSSRHSQGCPTWPPAPAFVFLGYSATMYRDVLRPVVAQLTQRSGASVRVLYDERQFTSATAWLAETDILESIWQHWDSQVEAKTRALQRAWQAALAELQATNALPRVIQDEGRSLGPQMQPAFTWLWRVYVPRLLPQAAIAWHILERHRPALVISPDVADPRTRLYYLLGRSLGIPTLEIQYGVYGEEAVEYQFFAADHLAAWGKASREVQMSHGVPAERITITGSPRHDSLVNVSDDEVAQTRARLRVPECSAMALFASAYTLNVYDEIFAPASLDAAKQAVFQAADRTPGLCLVVKPHPLENVRETQRLARGYRNILFADPRDDIRELIKACDAFITVGTTATMDALIAHKLTIWAAFPGLAWQDNDCFLQSGATLVAHTEEELARSLQTVVNGSHERVLADLEPARQDFLRQAVYRADGQASARIEALALQMAQSKPVRSE